MSISLMFDLACMAMIAVCLAIGASRGALRTLSGLAGTLLGALGAFKLGPALTPVAARLMTPLVRNMVWETARKSGLESILDNPLTQDTLALFARLTDALGFSQQTGTALEAQALAAGERVADAVTAGLVAQLAPAASFVVLFLVIKAAVGLAMGLPLWNRLPVIGAANRLAGALLGLLSGLVLVFALCAGLLRFAPEEGMGPIVRADVAASVTGGAVARMTGARR